MGPGSEAGATKASGPAHNRHPGRPQSLPRTRSGGEPGASPGSPGSLGGSSRSAPAAAAGSARDGPRLGGRGDERGGGTRKGAAGPPHNRHPGRPAVQNWRTKLSSARLRL